MSARVGDRVRYQKIGRGHKVLKGTGVVIKIWRRYSFVGWNVKDDITGEMINAIPSYGILKVLEIGNKQQKQNSESEKNLAVANLAINPRLEKELTDFKELAKSLRLAQRS